MTKCDHIFEFIEKKPITSFLGKLCGVKQYLIREDYVFFCKKCLLIKEVKQCKEK
jgi:hypothetical protein